MRRLFTLSLLSAVLSASTSLAGLACAAAANEDVARDSSGEITENDSVGVFRLRVGDCLNLPGDGLDDEVETLEATPCSEPHTGEVVALVTLEGNGDDTFPGDEAVQTESFTRCVEAFNATTGLDFNSDPDWDITALFPTEQTWNQAADRETVCIAVPLNGEPTTTVLMG